MILAAHQPQYLAYTGYFDKLDQSDIFILLDTVQYKKNEWINRNRLKSPAGAQFITVPVSFKFGDAVSEVLIASHQPWQRKHLGALQTLYAKAPYFSHFFPLLDNALQRDWQKLAELNIFLLEQIAEYLGIDSGKIKVASRLPELPPQPDLRLIELCRRFDCDIYLAGAGGREYMDLAQWQEAGIEVRFQHFEEPPRPQLHGEFIPNLSIVDLCLNLGPQSLEFLREARQNLPK